MRAARAPSEVVLAVGGYGFGPQSALLGTLRTSTHYSKGIDVLDAALCALGVFARSPKHGSTRHSRRSPLSISELVDVSRTPAAFREIMVLYLETYVARVSDRYTTRRGKAIAIAHFWRFLAEKHPEVTSPAQVRPLHLREYIPHIMAHALTVRRGKDTGDEVRCTAHSWLTDVRTFFSDLCTWALESDSPFHGFAPPMVPLTRHSLLGLGFDKARERTRARIKAVSVAAEARRADGSPLILLPHDCRRVFASEHLNNNTPVHVIQALLGHTSLDTVMIYAKLYPSQLIEEYRKTMRKLYNTHYGEAGLKIPTAEE
jgi:hypothetical protein